ncbi:MAG: histidine phosphatase family protein [Clostridia bacterium]|nr:histidine phosphatase family protein [Clostridia bacterium]
MKLLIVRHAEPDYALDSLTQKGFREAQLLADRLSRVEAESFFVSPLGRAQRTAEATLSRIGRTAQVCDWLQEFPGRVTNERGDSVIPWDFMPADWTKRAELFDKDNWYNEPRMAAGNVREKYFDIARGIDSVLEGYGYTRDGMMYRTKKGRDDTLVFFCHLGSGFSILSHLLGISASVLWQGFFVAPSSITTVTSEERIGGEVFWRVVALGDTAHLYAAGEPWSRSGLFEEFR